MNNQMTNTQTGAQAQVNNLSYAMQMVGLSPQIEREAFEEQMFLADLDCQAEQDAILDQVMLEERAYEEEQEAVVDDILLVNLSLRNQVKPAGVQERILRRILEKRQAQTNHRKSKALVPKDLEPLNWRDSLYDSQIICNFASQTNN